MDQQIPTSEQQRRKSLEDVARRALEFYPVEPEHVEFLVEETNVFFRVQDTRGKSFALKVFQEESSCLDDNNAEVYFLEQLQDIPTPRVIRNRQGEGITLAHTPHFPIPKRVAMYTWMEGEDLDGKETPSRFFQLGSLMAQLHVQTRDWDIPAHIHPKKWDNVFYYDGETPVYREPQYAPFVEHDTIETMDRIIPFLNERLQALYAKGTPQLIHADLNPWNVKIHGEQMRVLDFEEAMLGFPVHDMAVMLYYYRYDPKFCFAEVKRSVMEGYRSQVPEAQFDDEQIEMLMIARRVNFLNYALVIDDDPAPFIRMCTGRIQEFLEGRM